MEYAPTRSEVITLEDLRDHRKAYHHCPRFRLGENGRTIYTDVTFLWNRKRLCAIRTSATGEEVERWVDPTTPVVLLDF